MFADVFYPNPPLDGMKGLERKFTPKMESQFTLKKLTKPQPPEISE